MKVSKAIEILTTFTFASKTIPRNDVNDAIKLGIEALRRCQLKEPLASFKLGKPLPGETR